MSHSYKGPSGKWYILDAEGSLDCDVSFTVNTYTPNEQTVELPMRDILWLAALHVRSVRTEQLEKASDLEILGLEEPS